MLVVLQTLLMLREGLAQWLASWLRDARAEAAVEAPDEELASAEYDEERGVVFYPPVYAQRYAAVSDLLRDPRWAGRLEKVVDMGYCDLSFIKYLKEVSGVRTILGVDIESAPINKNLLQYEEYPTAPEEPLKVVLFQGNSADPDYRLIGCDAVVAIEMIEHMQPHDLERLVHTVFGFIKPLIVVFTTPNADFNVLFNEMLPNGMRHWDHRFEWTREQFNDWCSNIVTRYPQYDASSRGVGPGPAGTEHLGCCTQLALFINRDYQKQPDLTPDTLKRITKMIPVSQLYPDLESGDKLLPSDSNLVPSLTIIVQEPCMSTASLPTAEVENAISSDGCAQCDLRAEAAKAYLMTCDDESGPRALAPCRDTHNRTYEIDDVNCRLNCSTVRVSRFSAASSLLMDAPPEAQAEARARELLGELRELARALNLTRRARGAGAGAAWSNINWGDDAPYWNQYYAIVKEYEYPFESKSSDQRVVDLVSDEIHRAVDMEEDLEPMSLERGRLEIPIERLMPVVKHITSDVDRVKELLEWNGYVVVGDAVVHSRLVSDAGSRSPSPLADPEWELNEERSVSEVTTGIQESREHRRYSGDRLRRGIDRKLRSLRAALRDESDVASELGRVVDKMASLALRHASGRERAARERWMQCKLYDLLTLSENAIMRRKRSPAVNVQSSTPLHESNIYPISQMSLSSIITQKMFYDSVPRTLVEDEDRWLSGESEELLDSEQTVLEDTLTISCRETSEDSPGSPHQYAPICSPTRFQVIQVRSPMKVRSKLNRNLLSRNNIAKRITPLPPGKQQEVLKIMGLPRNSLHLNGGLQCYHSSVERRRKKHKKKHGRIVRHHLKPSQPLRSTDNEPYELMNVLDELAEGSDSSISENLNVIDLSKSGDNFTDPDNKRVHVQDYDSYTIMPSQSVASSYIVADNKIYHTVSKHAALQDYVQNYSYDLCEPSTSTGIRHTAANVQCDIKTFTNPFFTTASPTLGPYTPNCGSPSKLSETSTSVTNLCVPNDMFNKEVGVSAECVPAILNKILEYGGIQLHCCDSSSEDVVYHGQWKHRASDAPKHLYRPPSHKMQETRKCQKSLLGKNPVTVRSNVKKLVSSATERRLSYRNPMAKKVGAKFEKAKKYSTYDEKVTEFRTTPKPLTTFSQKSPFSASPVSVNRNCSTLRNDAVFSPGSPNIAKPEPNVTIEQGGVTITHVKAANSTKIENKPDFTNLGNNRLRTSPERLNERFSTNRSSSSCCSPCSVVTVRNRSRAMAAPRGGQNVLVEIEDNACQSPIDNVARVKRTVKKSKKVCQKTAQKARDKENYSSSFPIQDAFSSEIGNENEKEYMQNTSLEQGRKPLISIESNENIQVEGRSKSVNIVERSVKSQESEEIFIYPEEILKNLDDSVHSRTCVADILKNIDSATNTFALRNLFGRRDMAVPINANALAAQTFSGFSVSCEIPVESPCAQPTLPGTYGLENFTDDMPGRLTASAEVYIPSPSSDSLASCESADPAVPPWIFRVLSDQADAVGTAATAAAEGAEGAGAGDGRGVHTPASASDEFSVLGSTDTDVGMREALNLDGMVGGVEVMAPGEDSDSSSSFTSGSTSNTWVRVEVAGELGRRTCVPSQRPAIAQYGSRGGVDADASSVDTEVLDG